MRALAYIRVSTAEQAQDGHSIEAQEARLRAWCAARGYEFAGAITDAGVSAGKPLDKRPGGAELVRRLAAGEADVVVVVALNRIFRDTQDGLRYLTGDTPLALQSVAELIDSTTAQGRFVLTIMLAAAQFEREQTCERNASIARHLRASGRTNGHTPYGCIARDGRLFRDPATWPVRERIVELRKGQGLSLPKIAAQLEAERIPSPWGAARWTEKAISRVADSHDGLNHIPALPAGEETEVSPGEPTA